METKTKNAMDEKTSQTHGSITVNQIGTNLFEIKFEGADISRAKYIAFEIRDDTVYMTPEDTLRYLMEGVAGRDLQDTPQQAMEAVYNDN